ncbi:MAG: EscU/YscU/HrcU family type III secretion system export apparatus switch protein, partial [Rhodanobacter sp.]
MSEDSDQEKTEQPTEKRLRETREKGDVPRSRDLSGALVVLAGVAALMNGAHGAFLHARQIFSLGLDYPREALFSDALPGRALHAALHEALGLFGPVAAATLLAVFAAPLLLGGIGFSAEALQPKFERLDPIKGLGKIFAMRGLVELGKALLKLLFIGGVLLVLLRHWQGQLQATGRGSVMAGITESISLLGNAALWFGSILAL